MFPKGSIVLASPLTDEASLTRRVELAAPLAVGDVYQKHGRAVIRWALRMGGPRAELDDILHDVFIKVHRELPSFRGDAKITTWLYRVTRNVVRDRRRKERVRQWLFGGDAARVERVPAASTPDLSLELRQETERVYQALDGMSEKYRTVLVMFELEEFSGEQIAEIMSAKLETVWVWLHRARTQFAKQLSLLETGASR